MGRKKRPYYRIIAVDSRRKRDGAFIERLGYYHPLDDPAKVLIEPEKALKWLRDGAIPSQTVLSLLKREGIWLRFRLEKRGLPETQINQMMSDWFGAHQKATAAPKKAAKKATPPEPKLESATEEAAAPAASQAVPEEAAAAPTSEPAPEPESPAKSPVETPAEEPAAPRESGEER